MGDDAPHHGGPPLRQEAQRDPRLLRGWSEPGHDGDERLERRRARLVAEPAGASRRHGRAYRWHARHPWAGGARRRARAPLGPMARDGGRRRWVRDSPPVRDRSRRPRARFRVSREPCGPVEIWVPRGDWKLYMQAVLCAPVALDRWVTERKTAVNRAEVVTPRVVQDERRWLQLASSIEAV